MKSQRTKTQTSAKPNIALVCIAPSKLVSLDPLGFLSWRTLKITCLGLSCTFIVYLARFYSCSLLHHAHLHVILACVGTSYSHLAPHSSSYIVLTCISCLVAYRRAYIHARLFYQNLKYGIPFDASMPFALFLQAFSPSSSLPFSASTNIGRCLIFLPFFR